MCSTIIGFVIKITIIVVLCCYNCNEVNAVPLFYVTKYPCRQVCSRTYSPVCAGPLTIIGTVDNNVNTFYNLCLLEKYNCERLTHWYVKYNGLCYANTGFTVQSG